MKDTQTNLQRMLRHAQRAKLCCEGITYYEFLENWELQDACVFNLAEIGELVVRLDPEFKEKHKSINWRALKGLRNRIVHDYDGVDFELVWQIVKIDIPQLLISLEKLIQA